METTIERNGCETKITTVTDNYVGISWFTPGKAHGIYIRKERHGDVSQDSNAIQASP